MREVSRSRAISQPFLKIPVIPIPKGFWHHCPAVPEGGVPSTVSRGMSLTRPINRKDAPFISDANMLKIPAGVSFLRCATTEAGIWHDVRCYTNKTNHENTKVRKHENNPLKEKERHHFENLSKKIIGAAIEVHWELGPGFLEKIYEEALKLELRKQDLEFEYQKEITVEYLGVVVGTHRLDLIVEDNIMIELKAVKEFEDIHYAQLRSYLKATDMKVGLLLNFAKPTLEIKCIVN